MRPRGPIWLRENLPLVLATALWAGSWQIAYRVLDLPPINNRDAFSHLVELGHYFVTEMVPLLLLIVPLLHLLSGGRAHDFLDRAFWRGLAARYATRRVVLGFLVVLACMPFFYAAYRDWKTAIPSLAPFYLDGPLEVWDRWMHAGRAPWEWLQPLLGRPDRTHFIDGLYIFWFEVKLAVVLWMAFSLRRRLRARFFIAYVLVYVLVGQLAATAFSSAGPPYYHHVLPEGGDPFRPLLTYLQALHDEYYLYAADIQATLWASHRGGTPGVVSGISAFPSMHVAAVTIYVFLGFAVHRLLGWAFLVFLAATLVGSVHLGWHYAVDGYVAIVMAAAIWWLAGPLARRFCAWAGLDDDAVAPADQSFQVKTVRATAE